MVILKDIRLDFTSRDYDQAYGIDYFETFSHVVKPVMIHLVLSLAIQLNWHVRQLDVHAFLNYSTSGFY